MPDGEVRVSANVCEAAGCLSFGSDGVVDALAEHVVQRGLSDVAVRRVGCLGPCASGPLVDVPEHGRLFEGVSPTSVDAIVDELARHAGGRRAPAPPSSPTSSRWCSRTPGGSTPRTSTTTLPATGMWR